jgi:hypothetical protein
MTPLRWVYLTGCLLLLAGCASSGVVKEVSPVSTATPVSLDFVLVQTSGATNDDPADAALLNDKIITGLRETQIFGTVSGDQTDTNAVSGLKVKADIRQIKPVSPEARTWFGGFAGHAKISVQVTVTDLVSGKPIQTFAVEGESGASARSGTTDEAILRAAQLVVLEIVKISRQTSQ